MLDDLIIPTLANLNKRKGKSTLERLELVRANADTLVALHCHLNETGKLRFFITFVTRIGMQVNMPVSIFYPEQQANLQQMQTGAACSLF